MATDLNSVVLIGRLTRDAELSYLPSGSAVAKLSIAVNRRRREGEQWIDEVNYFDVSFFGKSAEGLKPYLLKGKQIAVQGALKQDRWEKDGQKFSKVQIVASNVELLGGRTDGNPNGGGYSSGAPSYGNSGSMSSGGYQMSSGYSQRPAQSQQRGYDVPPMDEGSFGGDSGEFPEDIPF